MSALLATHKIRPEHLARLVSIYIRQSTLVQVLNNIGSKARQFVIAQVGLGRVGAVFSLEASRLSRACSDWHRLIEICALTDTLVIDEEGVYDPAQYNDSLLLGLKGTMGAAELHWLRNRLLGGKLELEDNQLDTKPLIRSKGGNDVF